MTIEDVVFVYQMKEEAQLRWHGRFHHHNQREYELHYFLHGTGSFLNHNTRYTIKPGSVFVCRPFDDHSITAMDVHDPVTYYAVLVKLGKQDWEAEHLLNTGIRQDHFHNIGTNYRFFFEEIKERGMSGDDNLKLAAVHQLMSFLYLLAQGSEGLRYGNEENRHLERALEIMQKNVFRSIDLSRIAATLKLNTSYFIRLFRNKMGTTPMKYMTKLRMEAAVSLLISTDLPIYIISEKLKFSSEFHFSKVFKNHTGFAPSRYRKQFWQKIVTN